MDLDLKGKRALVTGSTAGIGYAIAESLAREGVEIIVNARTRQTVDKAISRIRTAVPEASVDGIAADGGTEAGCNALIAGCVDPDILVNNLGIYEPSGFFETPDAMWQRAFEVNVMSGIRLARAYGQGMAKRGWGRILFISSESAVAIPAEMIHYGMSKTAQLSVARGLAVALAGTGVTVNSLLPGPTRTEGVEGFVAQLAKDQGKSESQIEQDFFKNSRPNSLLKRFIDPQEVANLAVYLCGAGASATTGAALRVEGGVINSI
jgi:NAD(P)-dependent dehydrogenase (short-subunit alcohol dehydrogenase family)